MYFREYAPGPFYSRYIDSFFTIDTGQVTKPVTDLVVPDGTFGLLFIDTEEHIGRNCTAIPRPLTLRKTSLFGQKTKPVNYYYSPGKETSFGIKINPEGLPLFLSEGLKGLKNAYLEVDKANKCLRELENKVLEARSPDAQIKTVEDFMQERLPGLQSNEDYLLFCALVEYIKANKGEVRPGQLTIYFNLNYKKIERLFQFYMGITPKTYIRIIRFNAIIHLQATHERLNLTQLGHEAGFYDQSHFIREFKTFSSLTPRSFFTKNRSPSEATYLEIISGRWA